MTTNTINPEFSEYLRKHYEGLSNRKEQAVAALKAIFVYLQQQCPDLRVIEITYEGSGDSGQIEDIRFNPGHVPGLAVVHIDDARMPEELAFGRKDTSGRWNSELGIAKAPDQPPMLNQLIDEFAWDLAYGQHPGFEINEGGYGTIEIFGRGPNPGDIEVKLSHSERIESTNDYEYEF